MATTTVSGDVQTGATFQYTNRVVLPADVASTTSYADITDLQFYAKAGNVYRFRFVVMTTSALASDGHAVSINGPTSPTFLAYRVTQPTSATATVITNAAAYNLPALQESTCASASGNIHVVEGYIQPATSGNVVARIKADNTSVVVKGYLSSVEYIRVG